MHRARQRRRAGRSWWGAGEDRWLKGGLLFSLAAVVALTVIGVVKGCTWVAGNRGPAWMDFSASTNSAGAVRILAPDSR